MNRLFLIRHGQHDWIGKALVGRKPGIHLNEEGKGHARAIADRLRDVPLTAIYSSPQPRALETAVPLAEVHGLPVAFEPGLDEIDFGEWTGRSFVELESDPRWQAWNARRAEGVAPGGESMRAAQARALEAMDRARHLGGVALFSHADVIKAALLGLQGLSLNGIHDLELQPGTIVSIEFGLLDAPRISFQDLRSAKPRVHAAIAK
jgi:broad specificity phosphatase PhoE